MFYLSSHLHLSRTITFNPRCLKTFPTPIEFLFIFFSGARIQASVVSSSFCSLCLSDERNSLRRNVQGYHWVRSAYHPMTGCWAAKAIIFAGFLCPLIYFLWRRSNGDHFPESLLLSGDCSGDIRRDLFTVANQSETRNMEAVSFLQKIRTGRPFFRRT